MAIEVQTGQYMFSRDLEGEDSDDEDIQGQSFIALCETWSRPKIQREFFHNYLHDLESVWWIAMYSLFYTLPADEVKDKVHVGTKLEQERIGDCIFPLSLEGSNTRTLFMHSNTESYLTSVEAIPDAYTPVLKAMQVFLKCLRRFYKKIEKKLDIHFDRKQFARFYDPLIKIFGTAAKLAVGEMRFVSDVRRNLEAQERQQTKTGSAKRKRTAEEQAGPLDALAVRKRSKNDDSRDLMPSPGPSTRLRTASTRGGKTSALPTRSPARLARIGSIPIPPSSSEDAMTEDRISLKPYPHHSSPPVDRGGSRVGKGNRGGKGAAKSAPRTRSGQSG